MVVAEESHEIVQSGILVPVEDDSSDNNFKSEFPELKTRSQSDADGTVKEKIRASVSLNTFYSDIAGNINLNGSNISLDRDTELSRKIRLAYQGEVAFSKNFKFQFEYLKIDESCTTRSIINFDNSTYSQNSDFELVTDLYDFGLAAKVSPEEQNSSFTLHLLGGVKIQRLDQKMEENTSKISQVSRLDQNSSLPYVGLLGDFKLSKALTLHSSLKYLALNKKDSTTRLSDLRAFLIHRLNSDAPENELHWNISFGYRYLLVHSKANDNSSELALAGPTLGIEASF
jgi:hypothetical protein